jgi:hypothetical protein
MGLYDRNTRMLHYQREQMGGNGGMALTTQPLNIYESLIKPLNPIGYYMYHLL